MIENFLSVSVTTNKVNEKLAMLTSQSVEMNIQILAKQQDIRTSFWEPLCRQSISRIFSVTRPVAAQTSARRRRDTFYLLCLFF